MTLTTIQECEAYLEDVGLATILPAKDALLPCLLWQARGDRERREVWDDALDRAWRWKDDLPAAKKAWLGRLFGDRVVLLHRRLLPAFLAWRGRPNVRTLYQDGQLSREAFTVWSSVEGADEPMGRAELRRAAGLAAREHASRFDRACRDLEKRLLLTRAGRSAVASGWDANSYMPVQDWFADEWKAAQSLDPDEAGEVVREALEQAAPDASARQLARWMRPL